ncbi:MAG: class I SAM-dependent methyltransferase [Acidimicrobiales bacterium]
MDADDWNTRYDTSELIWHAEPNQFVRDELAELAPGTGLDVACGEGRNAIWLTGRGWAMTAIDFSARAIEKGEALAAQQDVDVTFLVADATTYAPDTTFDLVLSCYLQLPEPDRSAALARARDAVAPGGTLLLVAHDRSNLDEGHGGPPHPAVLPVAEEVVSALEGFVIEQAGVVDRVVETDDGPRVAKDTLVRARRPA